MPSRSARCSALSRDMLIRSISRFRRPMSSTVPQACFSSEDMHRDSVISCVCCPPPSTFGRRRMFAESASLAWRPLSRTAALAGNGRRGPSFGNPTMLLKKSPLVLISRLELNASLRPRLRHRAGVPLTVSDRHAGAILSIRRSGTNRLINFFTF
jgi:hypothetical protein